MIPFGFDRKVRGLRKKWCKLRMKSLKQSKENKGRLLEMLDNVENDLRSLEEQKLGRGDRGRIAEQVENGLKEVEEVLKGKDKEEKVSEKTEDSQDRNERDYE